MAFRITVVVRRQPDQERPALCNLAAVPFHRWRGELTWCRFDGQLVEVPLSEATGIKLDKLLPQLPSVQV